MTIPSRASAAPPPWRDNPPVVTLTRDQVLGFRRRVGALDQRLPMSSDSLRTAAWAGLQDSMPRAALLSIHARVEGAHAGIWEDESLVQTWGPRYSAYVVPRQDLAIFTLSRLPDEEKGRRRAEEMADRVDAFLAGRRMKDRDVQAGLAIGNALRYAAPTGRIVIRWSGALAPVIWTAARPAMSVADARLELARRFLHVFGPSTAPSFATWAGITPRSATAALEALAPELTAVRTPIGEAWLLAADEPEMARPPQSPAPARLLPSGDAYFLLQGRDRDLLLPERKQQAELWTPRVWPGAVLLRGEIIGVWRRANELVTVQPFRELSRNEQDAVEEEAAALPLPGLERPIRVAWT